MSWCASMAASSSSALPREAAVDGARGVAGPAGDLGDPGSLVALLGEHLGGRGDQLLPDQVDRTRSAATAVSGAGSDIADQDNDRYLACLAAAQPLGGGLALADLDQGGEGGDGGAGVDGLAGGLDAGGEVVGQARPPPGRRRR